jgi:putative component of membrane protein insertase Oxa1/YidC/SpoIIIJ protein YidD
MKKITLFLFLFISIDAFSQSNNNDLKLIASHYSKSKVPIIRKSVFFKTKHKWVAYNPINLAFKGSLFFYQNVISQQISAQCLYDVSCSDFSKQSIQKFGLLKGVFLSADRILRCNRISALDIPISEINDSTGRCNETPDRFTFKK